MNDSEKIIKGLESQLDDLSQYADSDEVLTLTQDQAKDILSMLKEHTEIIRCKDCIYYDPEWVDEECRLFRDFTTEPEWFCADGKRRDDDG